MAQRKWAGWGAFLLLLCTSDLARGIQLDSHQASTPGESHNSLICPTADSSDCYPATFEPTIHFQEVRPGQSIPPGLHVRLNIATGEKEARLNVPEDDEGQRGAVVVIDSDNRSEESAYAEPIGRGGHEDAVQLRLQDPVKHTSSYPARKAQRPISGHRPPTKVDSSEASVYEIAREAVMKLVSPDTAVRGEKQIDALTNLTELAHDQDWGVSITRDEDLCEVLSRILLPYDKRLPALKKELRPAVFLLLGTAIQNNVPASDMLRDFTRVKGFDLTEATTEFLAQEKHRRLQRTNDDPIASVSISRAIFFLSQLCSDKEQLDHFVHDTTTFSFSTPLEVPWSGLSLLQDLFAPSSTSSSKQSSRQQSQKYSVAHSKVQIRIANFLTDHASGIIQPASPSSNNNKKKKDSLLSQAPTVSRASRLLHRWCEHLVTAIEDRAKIFSASRGSKTSVKTQLEEDDAYQSFTAARDAIAEALETHTTDYDGSCSPHHSPQYSKNDHSQSRPEPEL